jgi:hypothetical protein
MTDRIGVAKTAPSTNFYLEADRIGQDIPGNYTIVRCYLRCVNTGNTTSHSNFPGDQIGSIDGIGEFGRHHDGGFFLPTGVASGAQRWREGPFDVHVSHGPDGTRGAITLRQGLYYDGGVAQDDTVSFNDFPAIPRGPHVEQGGAWVQSIAYVEQGGAWVQSIAYVEQGGAWVLAS